MIEILKEAHTQLRQAIRLAGNVMDGVRSVWKAPATELASLFQVGSIEDELPPIVTPDCAFPDLRKYLQPDSLVLDVGCGHGRHLSTIEAQGFRVVGLDCNHVPLAKLQKQKANVLIQANIFALPLREQCIDAIVAWQVVCQFPAARQTALFAEFHRVLKPDGLVVLAGCFENPAWNSTRSCGVSSQQSLESILPPGFTLFDSELQTTPTWPNARWQCLARKVDAHRNEQSRPLRSTQ